MASQQYKEKEMDVAEVKRVREEVPMEVEDAGTKRVQKRKLVEGEGESKAPQKKMKTPTPPTTPPSSPEPTNPSMEMETDNYLPGGAESDDSDWIYDRWRDEDFEDSDDYHIERYFDGY